MANDTQPIHIISVTVLIAGRPYLLKINAAEEALIHRLVKQINDKVAALKAAQPSKDAQDWLALALLSSAVEHHRTSRPPATADLPANLEC